jgi:hypothetical protein
MANSRNAGIQSIALVDSRGHGVSGTLFSFNRVLSTLPSAVCPA